jgi:tetratricopeptide (TPR) repeat protein
VHHREKRAYVGKRNVQDGWTTVTADDDGRLYHSNINRNAESVIDAVVDMLILAHSSIVGFSGSTFQNMARMYGTHAPMTPVAKPALEISYLSLNTAFRMIQNGVMSLGDALSHAAALYSSGRKTDAIQLEKTAIEYGRTKGISDVNLFVLHYNVAAHLVNEGFPYEASLYLENALDIIPNHAESKALLATARQRSGFTESKRPEPKAAHPAITRGDRGTIKTYMQWHLGDNLIHLHFLRKLSEKYPELEFQHALNPAYMGQCTEVIEDNSKITLTPLLPGQNPEGLDGWKGAGGFFFSHEKKYQFGALYLDLFAKLSKDMGLSTPFKTTSDLLFDYPGIVKKQPAGRYDVLLINSKPLSDQFKTYNENDFIDLAHTLRNKGLLVITSQKMDGFDCTLDTQCSVTDIASLSLRVKYFIAVCTGSMWPSINVFNQETHQFKIILNDHEIVDIGKNITMCTDSRLLKSMVMDRLPS